MPGLGTKTARRLYDELEIASIEDLKEAAEAHQIRELKGLGQKVEENVLASLERLGEPGEGPGPAAALQGAPDRRGAGGGAARAPGRQPGRGRRLGPALGRDLQGHRHHRHRRRADRARRGAGRPPADRRRRHPRPQRRPRADPQRRLGRPADRRPGRLRQPAAALHRLQGAQRAAARRGGRPRPLGLRARDHRDRERQGRPLRDRGGRLRAPRLRLHRAGAARGPRRAEGGPRGQAARPDRARRHQGRPALPHHALRRPQHAGGDGRGRPRARLRLHGDHRPLRQPRLRRPRHRRAALGADRGGPRLEQGEKGLSPARRLGDQHRPRRRRSTTPTTWSRRWTGSSPASTPPSRSRRRR